MAGATRLPGSVFRGTQSTDWFEGKRQIQLFVDVLCAIVVGSSGGAGLAAVTASSS